MVRVILYSAYNSKFCQDAKKFLTENEVRFDEVDLVRNPNRIKEIEERTGQRGVPVIDVDGIMIVGFDEEKLIEVLKL